MVGRSFSLLLVSLLGTAEAARHSAQAAGSHGPRFGLGSLAGLKEKLPRIGASWAQEELEEYEEEEQGLGAVAKALIGATLTAAGGVGAKFAYRIYQAKQKRLHASTGLETPLPKMPKGGQTAVKSRPVPAPAAASPAASQATPAPDIEQAAPAAAPKAPKKPADAKKEKEGEKEKEKVYTELPVDALDVSKLTTEQKEHFKAKMFGAKLVRHENGRLVEYAAKDVLEGKHTFLFFYHPDIEAYMAKQGLPSPLKDIVKIYNRLKEEKKDAEFVLVTLVTPEGRFHETLKQMPWYAVPQSEKDRIVAILQTLQVNQFPAMVVLDPENRLVNLKAYPYMMSSPEGFPWKHKTNEELLGSTLVDRDGKLHSTAEALGGKKSVALYFSASWCKPCKEFTPKLVELYNKKKAQGEDLEIVFVSMDENEEKMKKYHQEMPWLAVPFADKVARTLLMTELNVQGLPTLVVLDEKKKVITTRGREFAMKDPEGKKYPWKPQVVNDLAWDNSGLAQRPSVVVFMENAEAGAQAPVVKALKALGQENEEALLKDPEDPLAQVRFFYAKDVSPMSAGLRSLAGLAQINPKDKFLKRDTQGKKPVVALFDIQKQAFHVSSMDTVSEAELRRLVSQYQDETLAMDPIKIDTPPEAAPGETADE